MAAQLVLNRPESPVITIITTTSYNPSQSFSSGNHSAINSNNSSIQMNGQFFVNKCGNIKEQRICRDFVRGACRRIHCKYPHVQSSELVVFCHDFQNNKCPRVNCKFLHYSIEDEEHYRKFGEFPIADVSQHSNDFGFFNASNSLNSSSTLPSLLDGDLFSSCHQRMDSCGIHCHGERGFSSGNSVFRNGLKRLGSQDCMQQSNKRCREDDVMVLLRRFDEEHQSLKRRVEANELKIAELRASNEYLMTQNAQLRLSTVQVSRIVNPVTVTHTQSQQQSQGPQVISASMTPIQVATPIVSMSAASQIINPQNISGAQISINPSQTAQQILGASHNNYTLTPASISTPSIGLSINTSQALQAAISNATQPIISYPIMTHSILPH